jgi:hypothetical protein
MAHNETTAAAVADQSASLKLFTNTLWRYTRLNLEKMHINTKETGNRLTSAVILMHSIGEAQVTWRRRPVVPQGLRKVSLTDSSDVHHATIIMPARYTTPRTRFTRRRFRFSTASISASSLAMVS